MLLREVIYAKWTSELGILLRKVWREGGVFSCAFLSITYLQKKLAAD